MPYLITGAAEPDVQPSDSVDLPQLPLEIYDHALSQCEPSWDASDTNVVAANGQQLGYQAAGVQQTFLRVWGDKARQRWRWEYDCLYQATYEPDVPPTTNTPEVVDPQAHPEFDSAHEVAVARGAEEEIARQIAAFVVLDESIEAFLKGDHSDVLFGEWPCAYRSAACPLAPEKNDDEDQSNDDATGVDKPGNDSGNGSRAAIAAPNETRECPSSLPGYGDHWHCHNDGAIYHQHGPPEPGVHTSITDQALLGPNKVMRTFIISRSTIGATARHLLERRFRSRRFGPSFKLKADIDGDDIRRTMGRITGTRDAE